MKIRTTLTYEYDVNLECYPDHMRDNPSEMAELDLEIDAAAMLSSVFESTDYWDISAEKI